MLQDGAPQIGRHLRECRVKWIFRHVFLCSVDQFLSGIKAELLLPDQRKTVPLGIDHRQKPGDGRPADLHRLLQRLMKFQDLHFVRRYHLHT